MSTTTAAALPELWPTAERVQAVVSSVLLSADPFAQQAAVDYWDMSASAHNAVVSGVRRHGSPDVVAALDAVLAAPAAPGPVAVLARLVDHAIEEGGAAWTQIGSAALQADALGRLAAHLGPEHAAVTAPVSAEDVLRHLAASPPSGGGSPDAPVLVVIPFRDRTRSRSRLRNVLACLAALADQSIDRASYRVVVVEADSCARWEHEIRPYVDDYVHLSADGHFNKAWAVNVGVVQRGRSAELVCVLDADVLVDREFVERNVARFAVRGAQAHLPFRDALCLDGPSSDRAVRDRVVLGDARADESALRGVLLRRPPGHCVWVRRALFERVGGFDERFEGWGGEDLDLVFRLDVVGAVDRCSDPLLHLFHDRPQTQQDGVRFYAGRRLLSWRPTGPVGQLDGPASSDDDDLAGLIEDAAGTSG